ncbi:MAG: glycogen debranching protein GlgX [Actinobacteria bacterium]|nr:glycogen debranching protein GlgX [Actinomycetota bacterium]
MDCWPGNPYPLGATWDGTGTNFSLFSEAAEKVELCLFDDAGKEERIELPEFTGYIWHGYLHGVGPGQRYGYRVHSPYRPERGQRGNASKLLHDPYAKALDGIVDWDPAVFPYKVGSEKQDLAVDRKNSSRYVPKCVVVSPFFDWANDRSPNTPWHETIIYETHVKGLTISNPDVPPELRGTYAGVMEPSVIAHLKDLGVTAIELLPVHHFVHDHFLHERGLSNYWGYNSIAYFAPHSEYTSSGVSGQQVQEFKQMVRTLHQSGIEVILDVVYNHTGEGNHLGPMLCFRGIDNLAYYRVSAEEPRHYVDYTGTGNSMNMRHPHVLQLIMDSLRYWVLEMHVDGFRFDLAATLARELHDVDRLSAFFDIIQQDPVLSQVKLIAEPWDVGEGGYQVGNFPTLWSEWNGQYRDTIRDYWRGEGGTLAEFAYRFTGSSDLYETSGRRPYASINFITAHDGFTLNDLVSYNEKHNEANRDDNTDGDDHNRSWNHGVEGPTDDPGIVAMRSRQMRNMLTTLFLSQGIPMLLGGDEFGRTQWGNNNAYCQDNEISWYDWSLAEKNKELLEFTSELIHFRKVHPVFRRRRFFMGQPIRATDLADIGWFKPDGELMSEQDWEEGYAKSIGVFLNGEAIPSPDPRGQPITDESFYLLFNASEQELDFTLPKGRWGERWEEILNTAKTPSFVPEEERRTYSAGEQLTLTNRSVVALLRADQQG